MSLEMSEKFESILKNASKLRLFPVTAQRKSYFFLLDQKLSFSLRINMIRLSSAYGAGQSLSRSWVTI